MNRDRRRTARVVARQLLSAAVGLTVLAALTCDVRAQGDPTTSLEARLPAPRDFDHAMAVERQYYPSADVTRVWISSNEDDLRLHTPAGALNDMMLQVEYFVEGAPPGGTPYAVTLTIQTNGAMPPGPGPQALRLEADGRALVFDEAPTDLVRSGAMVFLRTAATVPIEEFVTLVNASAVSGRVWGHDFILVDKQLEALREMASGMRQ